MLENVTHNINTSQGQMCSNLRQPYKPKSNNSNPEIEKLCLSLKQVLIFKVQCQNCKRNITSI